MTELLLGKKRKLGTTFVIIDQEETTEAPTVRKPEAMPEQGQDDSTAALDISIPASADDTAQLTTEQQLSTPTDDDTGILTTLRSYDRLRRDLPERFVRNEDSTVDILTLEGGEEIAFCHLSAYVAFTLGDFVPFLWGHEDAAAIALAVQHLNTGNGVVIPEVEGLPQRCPVRFTTEWKDTQFTGGVVLKQVMEQIDRLPGRVERRPSAFLGAYRSAVSIPMSIATGLFDYPQISAASTSPTLDDPSQYPLFGRTIPTDNGNAVPIVLYIRNVLGVRHLAVVNVNDAFGNAFVEGMRKAAEKFAPDMSLHQIPLDDDAAIPAAVASLKATTYRYVFGLVFTSETHDLLMREAIRQGVAGTGSHTWLFGDSFAGVLSEDRTFPVANTAEDSSEEVGLHTAYRGTAMLEMTGGVPGMETFDRFQQAMSEIRESPIDVETLFSMFPDHNATGEHPEYDPRGVFLGPSSTYLKGSVSSAFSTFTYEAVVGLGLAACNASNSNPNGIDFTGPQHFEAFKHSDFHGFSGPIAFDEFGTRLAASAMYKVTNYQEQLDTDESGQPVVRLVPVTTDLFVGGDWEATNPFVFNDGTNNPHPDLPPPVDDSMRSTKLAMIVVIPLAFLACLVIGVYFYLERARKKNDSVWVVSREDIKFSEPPEIIGSGTFGVVLLGEFRGTQVAVKRVLPPKSVGKDTGSQNGENSDKTRKSERNSEPDLMVASEKSGSERDTASLSRSSLRHQDSFAGMNSVARISLEDGKKRSTESEGAVWKRLKREFLSEMRHLSKLRHPCITTVMGAVTTGEPMLIMEYMDHGSLHDLLHNKTMAIEGELILPLLRDITQGIRFLHSAQPQVLHGDLKSKNILVDSRFRAKVADFGLSQKENLGGTGTPYWMAPELLRQESPNTSASDVYAFGIILFEVFSRRDPYEGENYEEVIQLVADRKVQKRPPPPSHMPEGVKGLMKECVEDDPEKRPGFDEVDGRLKRIDADALNASQKTNGKSAQVSLFDIFPEHIAEALRDGRTVEAEHKECVTIFFSDIVGFTNISSELDPRKVADMLDRLYTKLDNLSNQHDIFKVETIGDAYMAVTNLVKEQQDDHAKRIANFAIDAIAAANDTLIDTEDETKGCVNIRVGFHSGSVVADVVGTRNPRYCLFGDTVNTASRMESNSEVNRIHCSKAAAKLLRAQAPELPMKSRGRVKIKGKGTMQTYWVNEHGVTQSPSQRDGLELLRRSSTQSNGSIGNVIQGGRKSIHMSGNRRKSVMSTLLGNLAFAQISEEEHKLCAEEDHDVEAPPEEAIGMRVLPGN